MKKTWVWGSSGEAETQEKVGVQITGCFPKEEPKIHIEGCSAVLYTYCIAYTFCVSLSNTKNTRQNETRKKGVSLHKRWLFTIWCLTQEQRGLFSIHTQTLYTETCIVRLEIIDHGEPVVALVTKKIRRQKRRRHKERDWSQTMKEGGKCVQEKCLYSNAWQCLCQVDT